MRSLIISRLALVIVAFGHLQLLSEIDPGCSLTQRSIPHIASSTTLLTPNYIPI